MHSKGVVNLGKKIVGGIKHLIQKAKQKRAAKKAAKEAAKHGADQHNQHHKRYFEADQEDLLEREEMEELEGLLERYFDFDDELSVREFVDDLLDDME